MESLGNTLSVILGQLDDDLIEDYEELKQMQEDESPESTSLFDQCQEPSATENSLDSSDTVADDIDKLEQSMPTDDSIPYLLNSEKDADSGNTSKPRLEGASSTETKGIPKVKLASGNGRQTISESFASRKPLQQRSGKILGEENVGNTGGAITGW